SVPSNTSFAITTSPGLQHYLYNTTRARPEREFQARLQVKERDSPIRELGADNAVRLQAQPIAVEPDSSLHIIHTKGDERDPRLHTPTWTRPHDCGHMQEAILPHPSYSF